MADPLLTRWASLVPKGADDRKQVFQERDLVVKEMQEKGVFPEATTEEIGSLYPDAADPDFIMKLLKKREFAESKQRSIKDQLEDKIDPCDPDREFELTPVQRFVSRLLSPSTPYNSALLFHGVGVGKTCAAITIAEGFLDKYPRDQVMIVAPRTIQGGFYRTIFDPDGLKIGKGLSDDPDTSEMNMAKGCTGNTYLKLSGTLYEQDKKVVESRVNALIKRRYAFMGYTAFANYITSIEKTVVKGANGVREREALYKELNKAFSGKVLIIDEAHNLRDTPEMDEENIDAAGGKKELSESVAGKRLTPFLRKILEVVDGITLVLLTGTPMYNSYTEIVFLLNLLLLNDKRPNELLSVPAIFNEDGTFVKEKTAPDGTIVPSGDKQIGRIAGRYVSFMRGENPLTFPTRLKPQLDYTPAGSAFLATRLLALSRQFELMGRWPSKAPNGSAITDDAAGTDITTEFGLPIVHCKFEGKAAKEYRDYAKAVVGPMEKIDIQTSNTLIQAGNWIFPGDEPIDARIRAQGFDDQFEEKHTGGLSTFKSIQGPPTWLSEDVIGAVSPKMAFLLSRLKNTKGCAFVYSRFIKSGALTIAIALEANGYTLWSPSGRAGFLQDGIQTDGKRQCAMCNQREKNHRAEHTFVPARYCILTGSDEYSPNNAAAIAAQRATNNTMGESLKIVIGSQVAGEGIDLRYIRELFLFDSWFHLNKLEQVVGRGIRTCSHSLLKDMRLRNCTVYLLVTAFDKTEDTETIDLYTYRRAIKKAIEVGRVTRVLKEHAVDCNLNHDAVLVEGLPLVPMIDGQGVLRPAVDRNDVPFTALCDWLENCKDYKCKPEIVVNPDAANERTYTEYAAKWRENQLLERVRLLFRGKAAGQAEQPFVALSDFTDFFSDIPRKALALLLQTIINSKSFTIDLFGKRGRILYKNGYFLFQPSGLADDTIPLALRIADAPVKRDSYEPAISMAAPELAVASGDATVAAAAASATDADADAETDSAFWDEVVTWSATIAAKTAIEKGVPPAITAALAGFHKHDTRLIKRSTERFEMISWLYKSIRENESWRDIMSKVLLECVWDEFLSARDQQSLMAKWKTDPALLVKFKHVYDEQYLQAGSTSAFRFVDPLTGVLRYICGDKECSELQVSVIESGGDPYRGLKADTNTTGPRYGFIVPKKGEMIFKNIEVPAVGEKVGKGRECSIASGVHNHFEKLKEFGVILKGAIGSDLDLTDAILTKSEREGGRKFENAVRACFLMDCVTRFMDMQKINKRRWMYRSISAKMIGHKGEFDKGA